MPVLRQRVRVQPNLAPGSVVRAGPSPFLALASQESERLARRAADYSRALAAGAEEEGLALAKRATFSESPNGTPQLPNVQLDRMGSIMRGSFNGAIEEQFVHQLRSSLKLQIGDAQNANLNDMDAFFVDAQERISRMAEDVPDGMEGVFQEIASAALADGGVSIGRRQGQNAIDNARSRFPAMVDDFTASIRQMIIGGDEEAGVALSQNVGWIDAVGSEILTDGQKQKFKEQIIFDTGEARMNVALDVENLSPPELQELQARLLAGDEQLGQFFQRANGAPDPEMMRKAAGRVSQFLGRANERQTQATKAFKLAASAQNVRDGTAENTKENREILDAELSGALSLRDATGAARGIQWQDWIDGQMSDDQRHTAVAMVKKTGMIPPSLRQALNRMENVTDPAEMHSGFLLLRDLDEQANSNGVVTSFLGEAGEKTQAIYQLASLMHGDGDPSQDSVAQAMAKVFAIEGEPWNDELLAGELNRDQSFTAGNRKLKPENAGGVVAGLVNEAVFEDQDIEPLEAERGEAASLFQTFIRAGSNFESAMQLTKQSIANRHVDSKFMAGSRRSAFAPEKHFVAPGPDTIMGALMGGLNVAGGSAVALSELLASSPFRVLPRGFRPEVDFGSRRILATPFEQMADVGIRDLINGVPDPEVRENLKSKGFLQAGRDYRLIPDRSKGIPPVYTVMMMGPNGPFPLEGVLDVRSQFKALTDLSVDAEALDQARRNRGKLLIDDGSPEAEAEWQKARRLIGEDRFRGNEKFLRGIFFGNPDGGGNGQADATQGRRLISGAAAKSRREGQN